MHALLYETTRWLDAAKLRISEANRLTDLQDNKTRDARIIGNATMALEQIRRAEVELTTFIRDCMPYPDDKP